MARLTNNILLYGAQGALGKQIVFKEINGKTFVAKYPDMSQVQFNDAQKEYQKIFGQASVYASDVVKDPERTAAYEKKIRDNKKLRGKSVYHTAHEAYMKKHSQKYAAVNQKKIIQYHLDNFLLSMQQAAALVFLVKEGKLTNAIYKAINKVSKATATRHLQDMISQGMITVQTKGAGANYSLAQPSPEILFLSGKNEEKLI